ncbi:MAG: DEAD/DEAH box helicase [Luminiphilus sp.]|nr:DEAD/DEAH box helicase [Luminiphilus sp.]
MLRDYQQRAIDELHNYLEKFDGNPCLVLPTGSGKSHIVAEICRHSVQTWPETRILMLTHVKELIEQNAGKMLDAWPRAPLGIYSAGLKQRNFDSITFAGIQSVRDRADEIGHIDLIIVDECHLINHGAEGGYRKLIDQLTKVNPYLRVIGLTATPYRLGHGEIHKGNAIFDDLLDDIAPIPALVEKGYLAPLKSKLTDTHFNLDGVKKRGGEFVESDLQRAVDDDEVTTDVVSEVIRYAQDRRHWLFFCAGVKHAYAMRDSLRSQGVSAETITGSTPADERQDIISKFKSGMIQALTNANVLTTGFDYPDIDLIALCRPTMSPGLYVQMVGRGMRPKSHADDCMVLDFAEVIQRHGPITHVVPPSKKSGNGEGESPVKNCPECHEIVHLSVMVCPSCGAQFEARKIALGLDKSSDIMGSKDNDVRVSDWYWSPHVSRASGKSMVKVRYLMSFDKEPITEYYPILHDGYAGNKARALLFSIIKKSGSEADPHGFDLAEMCQNLNQSSPPSRISFQKDGKWYRVTKRIWDDHETRTASVC